MFGEYGKGRVSPGTAATEGYALRLPKRFAGGGTQRPIVFLHGHLGSALDVLTAADPLAVALLTAERPILSIDAAGGAAFGNDASITRLGEAVDWLTATIGT